MTGAIAFNVLMGLAALGIASRVVPANAFSGFISALHNTIGITVPSAEKVRMVALIWLASVVAIVDGLLLLLVVLTTQLK